jgi:glutamine---fructose-6-phosphate transaminase (isomerizing)
MGERLKPAVLKTVRPERVSGVRIPLPPPDRRKNLSALSAQHMTESTSPKQVPHTLNELLSQPQTWQKTFRDLKSGALLDSIVEKTRAKTEWLFVACGSSLYLATAAASSWTLITGLRARAIPASEVLLFANAAFLDSEHTQAVLISRSGSTSETVRAAALLSRNYKIPTLAVTCTSPSQLVDACDLSISLPGANEESMVMTRSFTSLLLTMQLLAARRAGNSELPRKLEAVAEHFAPLIHPLSARMEAFVNEHSFSDYVFFGQGPFYGIACEGALKVTEMSCSYSQVFHTLEFRHGPKTIVAPETCLTFLLSESGMQAESEMMGEMKELGATTIAVCNRANDTIQRSSDLVFELGAELPELATLAPFLVPAQLLAFHTSAKKGMNADTPRNLSRVVILD